MALSAQRSTIRLDPDSKQRSYPVGAAKTIYKGGLVVLDAGYAEPGNEDTELVAVGIAEATVDNSGGSAGDLSVPISRGTFWLKNSGSGDAITQADVGDVCYVVDDQTVAKTDNSGARSIAGMIVAIDTNLGVAVELGLLPVLDDATIVADLDGRRVATAADANVIGGIPVVHTIDVADGATGNVDVTLTDKTEIVDVVVIKQAGAGGASDTLTVKNGSTAITDAMDINVADKVVVRAGTIDDASNVIAAAGTLRVTRTKSSAANVACRVVVFGILRA